MATKELEILIRARDQASAGLKAISNSIKELNGESAKTSSGSGGFLGLLKGVATAASLVKVMDIATGSIKSFKETMANTGDSGLAKMAGLESLAHSLPIASQTFDFLMAVTGRQTSKEIADTADESFRLAKGVTELALANSDLRSQERGSRPGISDASKFANANIRAMNQQDSALMMKQTDLELEISRRQSALNEIMGTNAGHVGTAEFHEKEKQLGYLQSQLTWIVEARKILPKVATNNQAEFNRKDEQRQQDAQIQGEMRVAHLLVDIRKQLAAGYKDQLAAELAALRQNTDEKVKLLELAALKEMQGKEDFEWAAIASRTFKESDAIKSGSSAQARLFGQAGQDRRRDEALAHYEKQASNAKTLRSIVIDGLNQEASLGSETARVEAERLKITEEFIDKRKQLNDIIRDEKSTEGQRNAARSFLDYLDGEEGRRKYLAGIDPVFHGSTAAASTGYFSTGVRENSAERTIIDPMVKEQRIGNERATEILKALTDLPDKLKGLNGFIIGTLN